MFFRTKVKKIGEIRRGCGNKFYFRGKLERKSHVRIFETTGETCHSFSAQKGVRGAFAVCFRFDHERDKGEGGVLRLPGGGGARQDSREGAETLQDAVSAGGLFLVPEDCLSGARESVGDALPIGGGERHAVAGRGRELPGVRVRRTSGRRGCGHVAFGQESGGRMGCGMGGLAAGTDGRAVVRRRQRHPPAAVQCEGVAPDEGGVHGVHRHDVVWHFVLEQEVAKGEIQYEQMLKARVQQHGLKNVEFAGFVTGREKFERLASLTALCVPSDFENFGMIVTEALSVGTPVIASLGTPWEELNTEHCGYWVKNDVLTLAETIADVLSLSAEKINCMGENGKRLVQAKYKDTQVALMMKQLYEWTLNGGEKPYFVHE